MNLVAALQLLDEAVPDNLVQGALRELLQSASVDGKTVKIELEDAEGGAVEVALDTTLDVVTKAYFREYLGEPFGHFRALVAIGGASESPHGELRAGSCFATLFLNADGKRVSVDFHLEVR